MGTADKVVRTFVAIVIAGLYFANLISGAVAIILLILAGVFILTSFMSFCPLYLCLFQWFEREHFYRH